MKHSIPTNNSDQWRPPLLLEEEEEEEEQERKAMMLMMMIIRKMRMTNGAAQNLRIDVSLEALSDRVGDLFGGDAPREDQVQHARKELLLAQQGLAHGESAVRKRKAAVEDVGEHGAKNGAGLGLKRRRRRRTRREEMWRGHRGKLLCLAAWDREGML